MEAGRSIPKDSERAQIASFVHLMLSDEAISTWELVIICRHLTEAFAGYSLESILDVVSDTLESSCGIEELAPSLSEGLSGAEARIFVLRLFALATSDGMVDPEFRIIAELSRRIGLSEREFAEMAAIFQGEAACEPVLTTIRTLAVPAEGGVSSTRLPAFFHAYGSSYTLVVLDSRAMTLNGRKARAFLVHPRFSPEDTLETGGATYLHEDVASAFAATPGTHVRGRSGSAGPTRTFEPGVNREIPTPHVLEARSFAAGISRDRRPIVQDVDFRLSSGQLCAIIGPAGSGKSILLKALIGLIPSQGGELTLDGNRLAQGLAVLGADLGYVPQDDMLQGDLTVEENLRFKYLLGSTRKPGGNGAKIDRGSLCEQIDGVLADVGLEGKRDRIVGTEESRSLSGGERRRLNIAMELLGRPQIIALDEPTTGLSSQDAEEIVLLIKRVARSGCLVFLVIHQPSAVIYELFDNVIIMGKEGRPVFTGDPFTALELFQASMLEGGPRGGVKCTSCGRVNPDILMKALKTEAPEYWDAVRRIVKRVPVGSGESVDPPAPVAPPAPHPEPRRARRAASQLPVQLRRCFLQKLRDRSSLLISLAGAPLLGAVCAVAFRSSGSSEYSFRSNEYYPEFLFMMIVATIFLGLSSSCTEVLKDRQMLCRERLSGVSPIGYYFAKLLVLAFWGTAQGALFIATSHLVLDIRDLWLAHWGIVCCVSVASVVTGLLVSALAKSRIAANNIVTLICLVEILLGGGFLKYSSMGSAVWLGDDDRDGAPLVAALMVSRWGYEAVHCAEISLSRWERLYVEEIVARSRIATDYDTRIRAGIGAGAEKLAALNASSAGFAALRAEVEPSYNTKIQKTNKPMGRAFLSPYDSDARGIWAYAWVRDLSALALYSIALVAAGLVLLGRERYS